MAYQFGLHFSRVGIAATDNAPTTSGGDAPAAANCGIIPRVSPLNAPVLRTFAFDGTTITLEPWIFLTDKNVWVQAGAGIVTTPAAPGTLAVPGLAGAKLFMRVTARTGVTAVGWRVGA